MVICLIEPALKNVNDRKDTTLFDTSNINPSLIILVKNYNLGYIITQFTKFVNIILNGN